MNRKERKIKQKERKNEIKELQKTYFTPISEIERRNIILFVESNGSQKLLEEKYNSESEKAKALLVLAEWLYEEGLIGLGHFMNNIIDYNLKAN